MQTFELDYVLSTAQILCYEGEGGDPPAGDPPAGDPPAGDPPAGDKKSGEATFTQSQLNEILAADRRKHQDQTKKVQDQAKSMETRLEKMIDDKNNSDAVRASLAADLEELRASQRTDAEQREHNAAKSKAEHENQIKGLEESAVTWEGLYKASTIERALTDAAVEHEAFRPGQIVSLLKDKTEMRQNKDSEGNLLPDSFTSKTAIEVTTEEGEVLTHWKSPSEVIKMMKENSAEDGNLFRNAVLAGIGAGTAAGTGKNSAGVDPSKLSIEEKARRFKEDPESLGLKSRRNY